MTIEPGRRRWTRQPTVEQLERDASFLALRAQKMTYPEMAKKMGCSPSTAHKHVTRAMRTYLAEHGAADIRAEMLVQLDLATAAIWPKVLNGDETAIGQLLRIQKRLADLCGLDAPKTVKVEQIPLDALDAEIARLTAQLAENDGLPQPHRP